MWVDKKRRTVMKAFSWRLCATLTTLTIVYIVTGELGLSIAIGGFDVILKMLLYYGHERMWNRLRWGKRRIRPFVLWLTGLPGSGKSTLAQALYEDLERMGINCDCLDGESIRQIFPETGFSKDDRDMHIRRTGHLAGMMEKRGVSLICSFVSPYQDSRDFVRQQTDQFIEVFLNAPRDVCEQRDTKSLYLKAKQGELKNLTGLDDPYEKPLSPEITIDTANTDVTTCKRIILDYLKQHQHITR